ncbi:MAG: OmpA family protein [Actinomycetota bacterium]
MADLFDEVNAFLTGDTSVEALCAAFPDASAETLGVGTALAAPAMVANMAEWSAEPLGRAWLRARLNGVDPAGLEQFRGIPHVADYSEVGETVVEHVLGSRRAHVGRIIAERSGLSLSTADGLLIATTWVIVAHLAERYAEDADQAGLPGELAAERATLLTTGWRPWLEATSEAPPQRPEEPRPSSSVPPSELGSYPPPISRRPVSSDTRELRYRQPMEEQYPQPAPRLEPEPTPTHASRAVVPMTAASESDPPPDKTDRWPWPLVAAGVVAAAVVAGAVFFVTRDRSDEAVVAADPTATTAEADAAVDEPVIDEADTAAETETATEVEPTTTTIDDWPGGRGPVPEGLPMRRELLIAPDGSLTMIGSSPSWETAQKVITLAKTNYPIPGVTVDNQITWHPDASNDIRSGDVVMDSAATFSVGGVEPDTFEALDLAADLLRSSPSLFVVVIGHTDDRGDEIVNANLAAERVNATVNYLISQGVVPGQIVTASAGEDDPSASNETEEGRSSNRRVEMQFKNYLSPQIGG